MTFSYQNKEYEVVIEKKISTKNTYIRVKKDLKVHVTTNYFTTTNSIVRLLDDNYQRITKMIDFQETKVKNNLGFFYLGKQYVLVHTNQKEVSFSDNTVFVPQDFDSDKWYKKQAKELFLKHLENNYNNFSRKIPKPTLRIRKMTSRWGVCNIKTHIITLNLELIKRDTSYLDYVIIHELSHLIYGDHSNRFWNLVEENMKDYRKYREEMKVF